MKPIRAKIIGFTAGGAFCLIGYAILQLLFMLISQL